MRFLKTLQVFNRDTSLEDFNRCRPKIAILLGDSKYYDSKTEMIDKYFKRQLFDRAVEYYCEEISDDSVVDGIPWKELKKRVIGSEEYKKEAWF